MWKSRASPAARGRISVRVTLDDFPNVKFDKPIHRAWWEHLLGLGNTTAALPALDVSSGAIRPDQLSDVPPSSSSKEQSAPARLRRPAGGGAFTLLRHDVSDPILEQPLNPAVYTRDATAPYHTPSSLLRLIPRMELFHKVMKDEVRSSNYCLARALIVGTLAMLHHYYHRNHRYPCPFTCVRGQF